MVDTAWSLTSREEITKVLIWYLHFAKSHKDVRFFCKILFIAIKIENFLKKSYYPHTYNIVRS